MTFRRIAVVLIALLLVGACGDDLANDESTRDGEGDVVEGGDVGALSLQVGDCIDSTIEGPVDALPVVPCDQSHDAEVFAVFDMPDGDFPGPEAVQAAFESGCPGDRFEEYVGIDDVQSQYGVSAITPTETTWESLDDREIVCLAESDDGSLLTESVRNTNR